MAENSRVIHPRVIQIVPRKCGLCGYPLGLKGKIDSGSNILPLTLIFTLLIQRFVVMFMMANGIGEGVGPLMVKMLDCVDFWSRNISIHYMQSSKECII